MSPPNRQSPRSVRPLVLATCLAWLGAPGISSGEPDAAVAAARKQAKEALKLAITKLQETAGPDQRVTARADILDPGIGRPHLTGVWRSWEIKATEPPQHHEYERDSKAAKFLSWLVSSPVAAATNQMDFAYSPAVSPVTLLGAGTLGSGVAADLFVTASKVPVVSPPGAYAWVVLDEGVKARINTPFSENSTATGSRTQQLGSGVRPGTEFIPGLSGLGRDSFEESSVDFENMVEGIGNTNFLPTAEQIAPGSAAVLKSLTHDVTLHSLGLFTDTARGGLKQDFHLLTDYSQLPNEYRGRGVYESRQVMPSGGGPSDPRWESFRQFVTIYKDVTNLTSLGGVPVMKVKAPAGWSAATQSGTSLPVLNRDPPPGVVLLPTIAKVQMMFSLIGRDLYRNLPNNILRPLIATEKLNMHGPLDEWFKPTNYNYDLHLLYTPIVTLHNPYNVALEFNTMRLEFIGVPFSMQVFRNGVALSTGLVPFESMFLDNQSGAKSKVFGMNLRTKVNGSIGSTTFRMLPGEVILFSPYFSPSSTWAAEFNNKTLWDTSLASSLTQNISAIPGWRGFGIGYDCNWLAGNKPVVTGEAAKQPPYGLWSSTYGLAWDDKIHVEFAPVGIPVNQNKFVIQLSAAVAGVVNKKVAAIEIDYESSTGLQRFLNDDGSAKTLRYPKADANSTFVLGHELRDSSSTPLSRLVNPRPFALLTAHAKNTSSGIDSTHQSGRFAAKPWAFTHGNVATSSQKMVTEHPANHSHELDLLGIGNVVLGLITVDSQDRSRFISGSTGLDNGTKFGNLYDIPLAPVQTLASLNGANPGGSSGYLPRFAQPIGNSWAHPLIGPEKFTEPGPSGYNYLDHSFLLNLALYDGFYFSGLADETGAFGNGRTKLATDFAGGTRLADPRLLLYRPDGKTASALSEEAGKSTAYSSIAAWQMMDGAFNINSTSVPAWKAMLASIHDSQAVVNQRATSAATATAIALLKPTAAGEARISRMRLPGSLSAADGGEVKDGYWLGAREYSDADLQTLAENIVKQVRLRGPFLSMAEFVNRRLGSSTDDMAQRGALQQAIDDSNINQAIATAASAGFEISAAKVATYKYKNPKAGEGSSYQGAPGYLSQADLLNVLGNAATPRSDTFIIRSYGESHGPAGETTATAVCEAVIQRLPDWVDPADKADTAPSALTRGTNQILGRGFRVISFRWLDDDEI